MRRTAAPKSRRTSPTCCVDGLEQVPGVAAVTPTQQNEAGDLTIALVTPTTSPASDATKDLVKLLRSKADDIRERTGIEAYVTGTTALNIDTADTLAAALPRYIAVVVGLDAAAAHGRVPLDPGAAEGRRGFLLSIAAAMGVVVWVFQDGNLAGLLRRLEPEPDRQLPADPAHRVLFGLAMDYEVFLVSRMRESFVHTGTPPRRSSRASARAPAS